MHFQEELWLWNRLETDIKADRLSWENLKLYSQLQKPAANFPISPPCPSVLLHPYQPPQKQPPHQPMAKISVEVIKPGTPPTNAWKTRIKFHDFCAARSGCLNVSFHAPSIPFPVKKNIGWEIPPKKTPEDRSKCQKPESAEWWVYRRICPNPMKQKGCISSPNI